MFFLLLFMLLLYCNHEKYPQSPTCQVGWCCTEQITVASVCGTVLSMTPALCAPQAPSPTPPPLSPSPAPSLPQWRCGCPPPLALAACRWWGKSHATHGGDVMQGGVRPMYLPGWQCAPPALSCIRSVLSRWPCTPEMCVSTKMCVQRKRVGLTETHSCWWVCSKNKSLLTRVKLDGKAGEGSGFTTVANPWGDVM